MISSVSNATIITLAKHHEKKYRDQHKLALVDGMHMLEEAYKAQVLEHIYGLQPASPINGVTYTQVSEAVMRKLCATTSLSTFVGVVRIITPTTLSQRILVLDGVQDPGNVGTLLRSALAFNFTSIILLPGCADPYNAKAMAASQGALFHCDIQSLSHDALRDYIYTHHIPVVICDVHQAQPLTTFTFSDACMLVVGSEGAGVSEAVKALATARITISTQKVESLNVAIAGSIVMHAHFIQKG